MTKRESRRRKRLGVDLGGLQVAILGAAHVLTLSVVVGAQMALANQLGELQQKRPAARTVHQQQAGSGPDEVLSIWCDHIARLVIQHHLDETASTTEEKATTAAQLEATTEMKA